MSEENVELVKRGFDAFAREGWRALLPFLHPEFEAITSPDVAMEPDTYRGTEGVRRYFESFEDAMEDIRFVTEGEFIDAGDKVVVPFRLAARGKETGIEVEQPAVQVWTLKDGKAVRVEVFASREQAFEAAGLDPGA
ncbi:MAG TPA: nuclear transport factor 2 family protein [Solirubrobacterales bacterium]|jgi:ketosteroid isomerase-like protein|nr:nuclear transport factor 2 family protein [Solirubrobacterales bacterium]